MLQERLFELETEYKILIDQKALRERIGISLDSEALAFLARYQGEKIKLEAELEFAHHRLESHPEHQSHTASTHRPDDIANEEQRFFPIERGDQSHHDPLHASGFEDRSVSLF